MQHSISFTISDKNISFFANGNIYNVNSTHQNFSKIADTLKNPDVDLETLIELTDVKQSISKSLSGVSAKNNVEIVGNHILLNGEKLSNYFSTKMEKLLTEGYNIEPFINFFRKILENPSENSRKSLFEFLDKNNSPITPDGYFIAFNRVRNDFMDIYTGTFDNSPGKECAVDRANVDSDINNTCSYGLHVAASSYLNNYASASGNKTIVVKVNPADVVAVPPDYNQQKMRVCKYLVLNEIKYENLTKDIKETEASTIIGSENKKEKIEMKQTASATTSSSTLFTTRDGREFSASIIKAGIMNGIAKYSKQINVAESTLRGWVKKITTTKEELIFKVPSTGKEMTASAIKSQVEINKGSVSATAKQIGVGETTLRTWLKKINA